MSIEPVEHLRRTARAAYSGHPAARLYRAWRRFAYAPSGEPGIVDVLLLPLTGLMLSLWVLGTAPSTSDAIAQACAVACMP